MSEKTYTKTFPGGNRGPSKSTYTVTPGRFSVTTSASNSRLRGSSTQVQRALFPDRAAVRIARELEADGWTEQDGGAS